MYRKFRGYCLFNFCEKQPDEFHFVFISFSVGTMTTILTLRVWLLFYDLKHGKAILSHEWWSTISDEKDWFIRNKNRYGSFRKFLWKPTIIIIISLLSMGISLSFVPEKIAINARQITLGLNNLYWIFLVFLFCKMPKEYDTLLIRKEINRLVIFYAFSTVWYTISTQTIEKTVPYIAYWYNVFYTYLFTIVISAMVTLWPHYDKSLQIKRRQSQENSMSDPSLSSQQIAKQRSRSVSDDYSFWTVYVNAVSDDKNWNKFMRHLIKELAVENLCFVLETMQFKRLMIPEPDKLFVDENQNENAKKKQHIELHDVWIDDNKFGWFMKLPNGLPQSSIIANSKGNYIEQINKIYDKYLSKDALLEINISFDAKHHFMTDYNQIMDYVSKNKSISENKIELIEMDSNPPTSDINSDNEVVDVINMGSEEKFQSDRLPSLMNVDSANSNDAMVVEHNLEMNDEMYSKLIKLFDIALQDIHFNLAGAFHRFVLALNQGSEDENEEIIVAIMRATKPSS